MAIFYLLMFMLMFDGCLTRHIKFRNQFYKSTNGLICQLCPVGTFLLQSCEHDRGESMCSVCPRGTFTDTVNSATECEECTVCRIAQRQKSPCTGSSDRVCECPQGSFWAIYLGYDGICLHHAVCKEDEVVAVKGTPTSDTICKKVPPTLGTLLTTDGARSAATTASKDDSVDVQNTNQNNSTKTWPYRVFKLEHRHKDNRHHVGVQKLWKPKHITDSPSANITEISTESHEFQSVGNAPANVTEVNTPVNETSVNAPLNETAVNAPVNETAVNAPLNETSDETAVNAPANKTKSYKSPIENGKHLSTILPNGITQNPQTQVTHKRTKTTSGGRRRRKRKRGKGKKLRRRRKKNRKNMKKKHNIKCRHKEEKQRKRCERRRKRLRHRKRKSKTASIGDSKNTSTKSLKIFKADNSLAYSDYVRLSQTNT